MKALALLVLLVLAHGASAENGSETLNHYGLVTLTDSEVGNRLAARFKARGQPVFLVHDLNAGLGRNDIMRFADKAVLVDADVWSTLQAEGALEKLRATPLVRVQGRANSTSWEQRSGIVADERQRKAFKLGAELLRVLEENFGGAPNNNQMTVVFEQGHLTLLAPTELLNQLRFSPVRRVQPSGRPVIVSPPPDTNLFVNQPFEYRIWGADPTDPSGSLAYDLQGPLPPGLSWDAASHTLRGTPTAPGRWRLTAQVRNQAGMRDTMSFPLRFRLNQPPSLSGTPRTVALVREVWRFDFRPSDPDHAGYDLTVRAQDLPPGMQFHPDSNYLRWVPDISLAGTRHTFSLTVEDRLGARQTYRHTIRVTTQEGILLSEGVKIELPWDTLVRGRSYLWRTGALTTAWSSQGIHLDAIQGPDSTVWERDTLRLRPMAAGFHQLDFQFRIQGVPTVQTVLLPVREDSPPEFVTELTVWKLKAGAPPLRYRPVAVDPEGERISLSAEFPANSPLGWDGRQVVFTPSAPGVYPARFIASDPGGKTAEQWVAFQAESEGAGSRWILESRVHDRMAAWTATRDFGTGRIGVFSPNLGIGPIRNSYWMEKETPYLFWGGNLMGRRAEARGQTLWADMGFNVGIPAPRFVTGGLYLRLNGEWHFPSVPLSWVEMEFSGHVHQAAVGTDSGTLSVFFKDTTDIISRDSLSRDGTLSKILRDGFRDDNVMVFFRFEALGPLGWGFFAGPSLWREDYPMEQRHVQRLGGALRYRLPRKWDVYQLTMRAGWSPGGEGWGAYGALRLAFGSPY